MIAWPRFVIRAAPLLVVAASLGSCAKVPLIGGTPRARVDLHADAKLNSCRGDQGFPLQLRVLQVGDTTGIAGASFTDVWNQEAQIFSRNGGVLARADTLIQPNTAVRMEYERQPGAAGIVLLGSFCNVETRCWYYVHPFARGKAVKLDLKGLCILPAAAN